MNKPLGIFYIQALAMYKFPKITDEAEKCLKENSLRDYMKIYIYIFKKKPKTG